jgi:hypothetical protein
VGRPFREGEAGRRGVSAHQRNDGELGGEGKRCGRGGCRDRGGAGRSWPGEMGAPEVGDDPDKWAPPVGECVREGEGEVGQWEVSGSHVREYRAGGL